MLIEMRCIDRPGLFAGVPSNSRDAHAMTSSDQQIPAEKAEQSPDAAGTPKVGAGPERAPEAGTGIGGLSGGLETGSTGAGIAGSDVSVGGIGAGGLVGGAEGGDSDMPQGGADQGKQTTEVDPAGPGAGGSISSPGAGGSGGGSEADVVQPTDDKPPQT
jgi:hypothetical protein